SSSVGRWTEPSSCRRSPAAADTPEAVTPATATGNLPSMASVWTEIGDRVYVRRYKFFDQNIVAILGADETLVVDTRTSPQQADEIKADRRELKAPPVTVVVDTHGHSDHVFGNHSFRPCQIWGHQRCVPFMHSQSGRARAAL